VQCGGGSGDREPAAHRRGDATATATTRQRCSTAWLFPIDEARHLAWEPSASLLYWSHSPGEVVLDLASPPLLILKWSQASDHYYGEGERRHREEEANQ